MTPNWTSERPTKPGEYWLSLPPDDRQSMPRVRPAYVYASRRCMVTLNFDAPDAYEPVLVVGGSDETSSVWPDSADQCIDINDTVFDGALWAPRETPADPFAKTDPMRTDQDGREYNHDDREAKLRPELLVQKAIQHLRKRKPRNGRGYVYPLWKRVADLFGHGSGYSAEICRRYGFDPDEQWMQQCPDCKRMVDSEELRPAPCNYEQDVNGNDTPYVMCRSCRAERNVVCPRDSGGPV